MTPCSIRLTLYLLSCCSSCLGNMSSITTFSGLVLTSLPDLLSHDVVANDTNTINDNSIMNVIVPTMWSLMLLLVYILIGVLVSLIDVKVIII